MITAIGKTFSTRRNNKRLQGEVYNCRHCERSEAIHFATGQNEVWIASSLRSSQ